ncbi:MAG: STAS-like domain-containing protein, partial [Proteobacteria bacterium]|nr:STAS-like domain-containing protein [Pseudomonadota bacterium]
EFSTTKVIVKLSARPDENISRSQARKLLFGLDKFETIVLDFDQVKGIGQGFSDEVFRIFQRNNPRKIIEIINANKAVNFMVERTLSELKSSK